ncbi:MAG: hypothetical protein ACRC62_00915, partial [Microcoleus sp.]
IDRVNFSSSGGIAPNFQVEYSDPTNQHFAMDNFTAEPFVANAELVPEPATLWGTVVFGILGVGMMMRGRSQGG